VQECKSSIAYIFRSQSARAQECKSKSKSSIAYIFRSQSTREQECKSKSKRARERMAKPRPFLRRIILRLGRITPWLAAAHQPSCRHGEGRAHVVENYPWHMRRLFVYHLEHRMSVPSCNGECEGGSPQPLTSCLARVGASCEVEVSGCVMWCRLTWCLAEATHDVWRE
jgi:hypothetical protein